MGTANVKIILINPKKEILLLHRNDNPNIYVPNKWSFVGGALDEGETPEEGIVREVKEEIDALKDSVGKLLTAAKIET